MLVLRRKNRESIEIGTESDFKSGNQIVITVFKENNSNDVSIGVSAPDDVKILRSELVGKYLEKLDGP